MKVSELLSTEDKWTQGAIARDKNEQPISCYSFEAIKWSLKGAVFKCYDDSINEPRILRKIEERIKENIPIWNDTHSYEEVMELVRELGI